MLLARATNQNPPSLALCTCGAQYNKIVYIQVSYKGSTKKKSLHTFIGQSNIFLSIFANFFKCKPCFQKKKWNIGYA